MGRLLVSCVVRSSSLLCLVVVLIVAGVPTASALEPGPEVVIASAIASASSDTGDPGRPAVASDGTNYLVVTCRSLGSPSGLIGVTVSPAGAILRTFQIAPLQCPVERVAVAFDGTNYLVAFVPGGSVLGIRVSPDGTVLDGPSGFTIAGTSGGETNSSPAVAFDGANYLVVWSRYRYPAAWDISAARVSPDGAVLDQFPVSTAAGDPKAPSVAFDGINYLVAWSTSGDSDVYGARLSPAGVVLDPTGIAISTASGFQGQPQITFGAENYFVVWIDFRSDPRFPSGYGHVFGARVSPEGVLLDGPPSSGGVPIHTTPHAKANPVVAFDGTNYLVAWQVGAYPAAPPVGIFAARVSPAGQLLDGPSDTGAVLVSAPPCTTCKLVNPSLASSGEASLLAWVNNSETFGTSKDVMGMSVCPAIALDEPASPCFGLASADYVPLAPGTTWTYRPDDGTDFTSTVLEATVDVNGVATRVVLDDRDTSEELYTNDAGGIRLHRTFDPRTFIPGLGTVPLTTTFQPPIQLTRATMRVGTTVRSSGSAVTNLVLPGVGVLVLSYTASATLRALETVTVPAGTFEVVRLEVTITLSGYGVSDTSTTVFFAARSLGVVRRTTTDAEGTESIELVDTSARPVLTVRRAGTGSGSVTSVPDGIACGGDCSETFTRGATVTLTATPASDSEFAGWSGGGCSGTGSCTVTLGAGAAVTATFTSRFATLTIERTGAGSGIVTGASGAIACGGDCAETLDRGTAVTLTAIPSSGSVFAGWRGGGCGGTGECTLTVTGDTVVTATFAPMMFALSVTLTGTGGGAVTSAPAGITCGSDCTETLASGTTVTLTAESAAGSVFAGWSGACSGIGPCMVTMAGDQTVTARFVADRPDLVVTGLTAGSATARAGGRASVTTTLENRGGVEARRPMVWYFLSHDVTKDPSDLVLGHVRLRPIAPDAAVTRPTSVLLPRGIAPGTYVVVACASALPTPAASVETDRCRASDTTVTVRGPDLVVEDVTLGASSVRAGGRLSVVTVVRNAGNQTAGSPVVQLYLSVDPDRGPGDRPLPGPRLTGALAPGARTTITAHTAVSPSTTPGSYFVIACVVDRVRAPGGDETRSCRPSAAPVSVTSP